MDRSTLVEARAVSKVYGMSTVLHPADFVITAGQVRGLVGSNGAGKSTLMKILTGAIAPTSGHVLVGGELAPPGRPLEMLRRGVACIYQHSNLVPDMSVLDNIYIGRQPTRRLGLIQRGLLREQARALLAGHGMDLDLDAHVSSLSTVRQKEVEILKALALDARVLLMDEPTGWLSVTDVARLHATIDALRARGVGIVYISHVMDEVFDICDAVTVMRDGRIVADEPVADLDRARVIELMVGKTLASQVLGEAHGAGAAHAATPARVPRLRCRALSKRATFHDVTFEVHAGEILCLTGLVGSKRTELIQTIFGADRFDGGTLELEGKPIQFHSPRAAIANGVGFVTEDRHRDGLMLNLSVAENLIAATLTRYRHGVLLAGARIRMAARRLIAALNVQPPDPAKPVRLLSGGNQQKVLLGKWLDMEPRLLILDEPTVGVDIGAKAEIYALLRAARDKGMAVLVVSSDLEEVMTIADRVAVMVAGRLVSVRDARDTQIADLVRDMGAVAT
jgi:ABC-type sugar transport system ATPase subunit